MTQNPPITAQHLKWINSIAAEKTYAYYFRLKDAAVGPEILAASREEQARLVIAMAYWLDQHRRQPSGEPASTMLADLTRLAGQVLATAITREQNDRVKQALLDLLGRKLPLNHAEVLTLLTWSANQENGYWSGAGQMIRVIENYLKEDSLTPELQQEIDRLIRQLEAGHSSAETRRWATRLRELGGLKNTSLRLAEGDAWADMAIQDIGALSGETQTTWIQLIDLCSSANGSKPSAKWLASAAPVLDKLGFDVFKQALPAWFRQVDQPRPQPLDTGQPDYFLNEQNTDTLKGLVWLCARQEDRELARALTALAISTYRKLPGLGPRCQRVGNACVWALGQMPGTEGIGQLAILKVRVKLNSVQKGIEQAITAAAERLGLPPAEVEEMTVPTYGLDEVGLRREQLDEFTAELVVTGTVSTELRWFKADGKPQKSVPKTVKTNHPETFKELQQGTQDIRKMLPAQRDRIENLYLQNRQWDMATWQTRYLDHPLVGTLARRIIWQFSEGDRQEPAIWYEGRFIACDGYPLDWLTDSTQVTLWHPTNTSLETILAWRNWLVEHMVQQPFKQAHREVYLLTDAERNTRIYSNRFAAHVLRQHQFNALCAARGWKNQLRLMVDDTYPPATRLLPNWGLRAEFWIEGAGDRYGFDTNETGTYLYLSTDQVRFYPIEATENWAHAGGGGYRTAVWAPPPEPVPLEEIPPLVFTEIMRDVDLFVGVASVGNDPTWSDGGPDGRYQTYWTSYSFGDLSELAKTRKQVLERLLPRLKIADRCQLTDRFLVVQGDIRAYKIHLGSGNILMAPNDQYLCIVPARGGAVEQAAGGKLFLPFEGDTTLAIILSKAFMLAEDKKITDPTIIHQLNY